MKKKVYYGEQTRKAIENFGSCNLNRDFIRAFGETKEACLQASFEYKKRIPHDVFSIIIECIDLIIQGEYDDQFVAPIKQGSAGTSINMNFNEVIANLASETYNKRNKDKKIQLDPIEDINIYQSTNDVFPTVTTVFLYRHLLDIENATITLQENLVKKENEYSNILITGRTEMQNALPITLGQVFGSWAGCIQRDRWRLNKLKERIRTIALGGTAIGTCFFAPREYVFIAEKKLREITGLPLCRSQNLPDEISNQDKLSELAGGYRLLAENLFKITGDLLLYSSSFLNEIEHPKLQYGSSIMPAKNNPVILEFVKGLSIDIQGEYYKISQYSQNGQLQLNAFLPFIINNFTVIHDSLIKAINVLCDKFINLITINKYKIESNLVNSYVLLNTLLPVLGYNELKKIYMIIEKANPKNLEEFKNIIKNNTHLDIDIIEYYTNPVNITTFLGEDYKK